MMVQMHDNQTICRGKQDTRVANLMKKVCVCITIS